MTRVWEEEKIMVSVIAIATDEVVDVFTMMLMATVLLMVITLLVVVIMGVVTLWVVVVVVLEMSV